MATFQFEGHSVYYEEHGAGSPLLILNGIFMSCASWQAFLPAFGKNNRLILADMLDQGKTDKVDFEYTQEIQVRLIAALLDHLGIEKTDVCGISYGGEVAMQLAIAHPARVNKLVLSNTTAVTNHWLRDIGHSWEYAYNSNDGHQFFKTCIPTIYAPDFYEKNYAWASAREDLFVKLYTPEVYAAFGRLTRSAEHHDARAGLGGITAQTLVISSELDCITPLAQQKELAAQIPGAGHVMVMGAGHALMYERPAEFTSLVLGFVNSDNDIRIVG